MPTTGQSASQSPLTQAGPQGRCGSNLVRPSSQVATLIISMGQLACDSFTALHRIVNPPGSHSQRLTGHTVWVESHSPDTVAYQAVTDLAISQPEIPSG